MKNATNPPSGQNDKLPPKGPATNGTPEPEAKNATNPPSCQNDKLPPKGSATNGTPETEADTPYGEASHERGC